MPKGKATVTPEGLIKALDTSRCEYVYIENKLVDEHGELTIYIDGDHSKHYCFLNLTNDPIADTATKLRMRHGRKLAQQIKYQQQATKLEKESLLNRVIKIFTK